MPRKIDESGYTYLGNFEGCEQWVARSIPSDPCKVTWTVGWENPQCPEPKEGELPVCHDIELDLS